MNVYEYLDELTKIATMPYNKWLKFARGRGPRSLRKGRQDVGDYMDRYLGESMKPLFGGLGTAENAYMGLLKTKYRDRAMQLMKERVHKGTAKTRKILLNASALSPRGKRYVSTVLGPQEAPNLTRGLNGLFEKAIRR